MQFHAIVVNPSHLDLFEFTISPKPWIILWLYWNKQRRSKSSGLEKQRFSIDKKSFLVVNFILRLLKYHRIFFSSRNTELYSWKRGFWHKKHELSVKSVELGTNLTVLIKQSGLQKNPTKLSERGKMFGLLSLKYQVQAE